jgi:cell division protein FtsB
MTATDMEHLSQPVEQAALPAPEPYSPPPPMPRVRPRRSWRSVFEGRERRLWTAALAGALLVAVAGIGALYLDDTSNQAAIRSLTTQNESLTGRNQNLNDQLKTTQSNLTATLGELAQTKADLAHPHLTIWNVPQQIAGSKWYLAGGIPDTFTYHLQATSTGPMSVSILTLEQWAAAIRCIENGAGTSHYCMHHSGAVMSFQNVTSVNYDFHLAEGCADYLSVFTSASNITVTPNVSVTYNPSTSTTGACS